MRLSLAAVPAALLALATPGGQAHAAPSRADQAPTSSRPTKVAPASKKATAAKKPGPAGVKHSSKKPGHATHATHAQPTRRHKVRIARYRARPSSGGSSARAKETEAQKPKAEGPATPKAAEADKAKPAEGDTKPAETAAPTGEASAPSPDAPAAEPAAQ